MNISEIARKTGLTSKAIRFYEEKGLVTTPARHENGYRSYDEHHLHELTLLRQARRVGFTLDECAELLDLFRDPARQSAKVKAHALQKISHIEQQIADLQAMREQLLQLAATCPGDESQDCPIIEGLSGCSHHRDSKK